MVRRPGYAARRVAVATTLLDAEMYPSEAIAELLGQRWHCEPHLRSIKQVLGKSHLPCKASEMVRQELWTHLLSYNLIHLQMARAAALRGGQPRQRSFKASRVAINVCASMLAAMRGACRELLESTMFDTIARSKVRARPRRQEPRAVKKRNARYPYLTKPGNNLRHQQVLRGLQS